jgi:AcrR family transcriptional regulator
VGTLLWALISGPSFQELSLERCSILEHRSSYVKMVLMVARTQQTRTQRTQRRADALSKERIVEAAVEILDAEGESALTVRALAARLATGSGAIYWHVASKNDLLAAATDDVIARVMTEVVSGVEPREAIRVIALGVFDAIDAHPWVGTQISRAPWQFAMLQILEGIGEQLQVLGVPQAAQFDSASALLNYILGLAGQYAAARLLPRETDRSAFLADVAARWARLDPAQYPFLQQVTTQLREHDDREQFLAGIDLILAGITTAR